MTDIDDREIRVTIRTGTSTRRPIERLDNRPRLTITIEQSTRYSELNLLLEILDILQYDDIVQDTIHDGELERDECVELDIERRNCQQTEIGCECTICKDIFLLGQKLTTLETCSHTFHHNCINEWGKYKQECPLCRSIIPIVTEPN